MSKKTFFIGTFVLAGTGILSRFIGFFYRIFLSRILGAAGLGIFQLTVPVQSLLTAIAVGGIQTAISRLCASASALKNHEKSRDYFLIGTFLAMAISVFLSVILHQYSFFISSALLKEPQTQPLIQILSYSLPLNVLHICMNSYYFSQKKTGLPSILQLLEQCVRVLTTYFIYLAMCARNLSITPAVACIGALLSECAVSAVGVISLVYHFLNHTPLTHRITQIRSKLKTLTFYAFPLTLNKILITLLGSIEVILIPQQLSMSGMSTSHALAIYGILSGMALPLIFFPSTLTNSVSVMLMPSVAELKTLRKIKQLKQVILSSYKYIFSLGILFMLFFLFLGPTAANFLFHNAAAGLYIRILAFACPFLYLNTTLTSILNGLGKVGICLLYNSVSICIRICSVIFLIPILGIEGYLYGVILSEFTKTILYSFSLCSVSI